MHAYTSPHPRGTASGFPEASSALHRQLSLPLAGWAPGVCGGAVLASDLYLPVGDVGADAGSGAPGAVRL